MHSHDVKFKKAIFIISIFTILIITAVLTRIFIFPSENQRLTETAIITNLKNSDIVYSKIDNIYYEVQVTDKFIVILQQNAWIESNRKNTEEMFDENVKRITIHLSDAYEFYIYSDKNFSISAYDGHSKIGEKSSVYYVTKGNIYELAKNYIIDNGLVIAPDDEINYSSSSI